MAQQESPQEPHPSSVVWSRTTTTAGIDLRDLFAAFAMNARLQAAWSNTAAGNEAFRKWKDQQGPDADISHAAYIAFCAYDMADAMLAARGGEDELLAD